MRDLFIDCSFGLSGDMLLAGLLDMGVPFKVIEQSLSDLGMDKRYSFKIEESHSMGFRGSRVFVKPLVNDPGKRTWIEIRDLINSSKLKEEIKVKVLNVFEILAKAEASVHGVSVDKVHFHEIGSIDTIFDIVGVCSALESLNLNNIYSTYPPSGSGTIQTNHGELNVPVPVVLELAKIFKINLFGTKDQNIGELTTPTGLALLIVFSDYFLQPESFLIKSIGVGLGTRSLNKPNLLRVCLLEGIEKSFLEKGSNEIIKSSVISQEAWIDDSSAEDLSLLMDQLRNNGALEVVSESIQMKKGRNGISVKALVRPELAEKLRLVWFANSSTIGLRERIDVRWLLHRRMGTCETSFGKVLVKQVKRPDGRYTLKPEFDELSRISYLTGIPIEEIRNEILNNSETFIAEEDWSL